MLHRHPRFLVNDSSPSPQSGKIFIGAPPPSGHRIFHILSGSNGFSCYTEI
jgi:hypothetical protein